MIDETRTQWFDCTKDHPEHDGNYEIRLKDMPSGIILCAWTFYYGWHCSGSMKAFEWRGLAVKP